MRCTWDGIERYIAVCTQCPLSRSRHWPVMGRGNHQSDLMISAEVLGWQEDRQGLPFAGRSWEIPDDLLRD